jgi:HAD superfamily hydrolase (TIGR01509 family)
MLPDLSNISTVLLDMDGTLLDLHFDDFFWNQYLHRRYAQIHGVPTSDAATFISRRLDAAVGSLNWYCTDYWSSEFNLDILKLKRELVHLIRYRTGSRAFLDCLAETQLQVILVTNAHPDVLALKHDETGLLGHIPNRVTSHDYGAPKESPEFWKQLRAAHEFDPAEALLIDDSIPVLTAARCYGIGITLGISQPNSSGPSGSADGFFQVDDLSTLNPLLAGHITSQGPGTRPWHQDQPGALDPGLHEGATDRG